MASLTFDEFKVLAATNEFKEKFNTHRTDIIDLDNGVMRIYAENINKYLETYACKNATELEDTLYYNYGIFCQVID